MSSVTRIPLVRELYQAYLNRQDSASFVQQLSAHYTTATLERLLVHGTREDRRAAALGLGLLGDFTHHIVLGRALHDDDRLTRTLAEHSLRMVWRRDGDEGDRQHLAAIVRLNQSRHFQAAADEAGRLLARCPTFAEAWNQRAIATCSLSRWHASIRDCEQTLALNPFHFDACAGLGQCYLHLNDEPAALEALRRALSLNPNLEAVRAGVEYLRRRLGAR